MAGLAVSAKGFAEAKVLGLSQHHELAVVFDRVSGHIIRSPLGVSVLLEFRGEYSNDRAAELPPMFFLRGAKEEEEQVGAVEIGETQDTVAGAVAPTLLRC